MRVVGAGCFVFLGLLGGVLVLSSRLPPATPSWVLGALQSAWLLVLIFLAMFLFNVPGQRPGDTLESLERLNLVASVSYRARRSFVVKEYEDEGPHYFIELEGGAVLYLNGQYLLDYRPDLKEAEGAAAASRKFPCTEFTVKRHRTEGYVLDIVCGGEAFEPELWAPPFAPERFGRDLPEDGQVITETSYDSLKPAMPPGRGA
ncbi:MAG: hypothetical protein HYZ53_25205 [Planctomycetes bacterium]|nr:hypothetical protein [Planctomycetota bacterium]